MYFFIIFFGSVFSALHQFFFFQGFVEKEIKKANIAVVDTGENPEVPFPRDMIDLEVTKKTHAQLKLMLKINVLIMFDHVLMTTEISITGVMQLTVTERVID